MRRNSVAMLMLGVAFVAINLGLVRFLVDVSKTGRDSIVLLLGLLPLADAIAIALSLVRWHYRTSLFGRARGERGGFAARFAVLATALLVVCATVCLLTPDTLFPYINWTFDAFAAGLAALGATPDFGSRPFLYVVLPAFLGTILSGPPLMAALAVAAASNRRTI